MVLNETKKLCLASEKSQQKLTPAWIDTLRYLNDLTQCKGVSLITMSEHGALCLLSNLMQLLLLKLRGMSIVSENKLQWLKRILRSDTVKAIITKSSAYIIALTQTPFTKHPRRWNTLDWSPLIMHQHMRDKLVYEIAHAKKSRVRNVSGLPRKYRVKGYYTLINWMEIFIMYQ